MVGAAAAAADAATAVLCVLASCTEYSYAFLYTRMYHTSIRGRYICMCGRDKKHSREKKKTLICARIFS